jgi:hypothetical protein
MKIHVYKNLTTAYPSEADRSADYMDHPYHIFRDDGAGKVDRACTRYLGDATSFAKAMLALEVNHCMWWVFNMETDRLCAKWEYLAGKIRRIV